MSKTTSPEPKRTSLDVASSLSMALLLAIEARVLAEAPTADADELEKLTKLGDRANGLLSECRKLEKAQGQLATGITRELIVAWAKQQPRESRARLLADLVAMDSARKASVLG